jgi:hypothetical protein
MSRCALLFARFLLAAWFGAATLFVIIGVREVSYPGFESAIRDQLVLLRFPCTTRADLRCWGARRSVLC